MCENFYAIIDEKLKKNMPCNTTTKTSAIINHCLPMSAEKHDFPYTGTGYDAISKGISDLVTHFIEAQNLHARKTYKNLIFALTILLGVDIFKTIVQNFIKEQQKIINEQLMTAMKNVSVVDFLASIYRLFADFFFGFMNKMRGIVSGLFYKKQLEFAETPCEEIVERVPVQTLVKTVKPNKIFCESLVNYITTEKTGVTYDEICKDEVEIGDNGVKYDMDYRNVAIEYEGMKMEIEQMNAIGEFSEERGEEDIFCWKNVEEFVDAFNWNDMSLSYCDIGNSFKITISGATEFEFSNKLKPMCDNSIIRNTIIAIFIVVLGKTTYHDTVKYIKDMHVTQLKKYFVFCDMLISKTIRPTCYFPFNVERIIKKKFANLVPQENVAFNFHAGSGYVVCNTLSDLTMITKLSNSKIGKYFSLLTFSQTSSTSTTTDFSITLSSSTLSTKQMHNTFKQFVEHVKKNSKLTRTDTEVKVFTIIVQTTTKTTTIPNPENAKFHELKERMQSAIKTQQPEITEKELAKESFAQLGIEPEKTIPNYQKEKSIQTNEINNKYYSFSNLYLRKGQDTELYDLCNKFKNDKITLKRLGIPNKLVICLHGEAGTGKSTTINALGSLLGRDIFYVNIKGYMNEDVKMIFDHINKTHQGGGIIALEDFDTQSAIVTQGSDTPTTQSLTDLMNASGENLTLDYLLNLFDGTLTYDDSIIVITTNHPESFNIALKRPERINMMIEYKKADHYQIKKMFKNFMNREISDDVLEKIEEDKFVPAEIIGELRKYYDKQGKSDVEIMGKFLTKNVDDKTETIKSQ